MGVISPRSVHTKNNTPPVAMTVVKSRSYATADTHEKAASLFNIAFTLANNFSYCALV